MRKLACLLIPTTMILVGCDDEDIDFNDGIDGDLDDVEQLDDEANDEDGNFVELTANISGIGQNSAVSGVSRVLLDTPGVFDAEIEVRSDTSGAVRPWHVHFGTCATGGGIVGPPEAYRPLTIGADGTSEVSAQVAADFDVRDAYHVNVHVSPADLTVIACGDLDVTSEG